jgi:hypothetical protein
VRGYPVGVSLAAPRSLLPEVHQLYFNPQYQEFSAHTLWNLSNAFTSAFKLWIPFRSSKQRQSWAAFLLNCLHEITSGMGRACGQVYFLASGN